MYEGGPLDNGLKQATLWSVPSAQTRKDKSQIASTVVMQYTSKHIRSTLLPKYFAPLHTTNHEAQIFFSFSHSLTRLRIYTICPDRTNLDFYIHPKRSTRNPVRSLTRTSYLALDFRPNTSTTKTNNERPSSRSPHFARSLHLKPTFALNGPATGSAIPAHTYPLL
jgi:hypothetical protein